MKQELVVATRNKKKLEEIKEILKGLNLKISSLADYPKERLRIIENGRTFRENAVKKGSQDCALHQKIDLRRRFRSLRRCLKR